MVAGRGERLAGAEGRAEGEPAIAGALPWAGRPGAGRPGAACRRDESAAGATTAPARGSTSTTRRRRRSRAACARQARREQQATTRPSSALASRTGPSRCGRDQHRPAARRVLSAPAAAPALPQVGIAAIDLQSNHMHLTMVRIPAVPCVVTASRQPSCARCHFPVHRA